MLPQGSTPRGCTLPYPDRYFAAARVADSGLKLSDEVRLILYALQQQATNGPCNEPQPSTWNFVEQAKWKSWKHLGTMPQFEAMRLFVQTVEQHYPEWYMDPYALSEETSTPTVEARQESNGTTAASSVAPRAADLAATPAKSAVRETPTASADVGVVPLSEQAVEGQWTTVEVKATGGKVPPPRYEQGLVLSSSKLFLLGGNGTGSRYLNDVWCLDLFNLQWTQIHPKNTNISTSDPPSQSTSQSNPNEHSAPQAAHSELSNGADSKLSNGAESKLSNGAELNLSNGANSKLSNAADSKLSTSEIEPAPENDRDNTNPPAAVANGKNKGDNVVPIPAPPPATAVQNGIIPVAGHTLTCWLDNIYVVGGRVKSKYAVQDVAVHVLDVKANTWTQLEAAGQVPSARGGHSTTLINGCLWVFGGEDNGRRPLGDLHVLDLQSLEWRRVEPNGECPAARAAHTAVAYGGHYMVLFGGGSGATCFNDLWVLDTRNVTWFKPRCEGPAPSPRAGHAGALQGGTWYLMGGGNNIRGCTDMVALSLSNLGHPDQPLTWTHVCTTPPRSPLSSEGLGLVAVNTIGCLVTFGGYNGQYNNTVSVYRIPVAALANGDRQSSGGEVLDRAEEAIRTQQREAAEAERKMQALRKEVQLCRDAITLLQRQVNSLQQELLGAEQKLEVAAGQLETERQQSAKLTQQLTEAEKERETMVKQIEQLTAHVSKLEQKQASSGSWSLWGS